ncbi:tRNA-uridine aminocarboxypropyltransferase 2 [Linum grandiflorum]
MRSPDSKKRPTCPSCSKPLQICLCAKLKHHGGSLLLENKVSVTILQHSLETKHPLNSARIAKIGLKNVRLHTVSDVLSDARFVIQFPTSIVTMKILKGGAVVDLNCCESTEGYSNFDEILASPSAKDGFTVQKLSRRKMNGVDSNQEEHQEFELEIPAGTVLLYPSEESVGVDELRGMDVEVKNLIVLDGTWSKAKKMYKENPWLKLVPHLKLDLEESSLFSEVRRQPRAGCLSTIESIVYALKEVGEKPEERLDQLLEVLGSMVDDQRRFRDERPSRISSSSTAPP